MACTTCGENRAGILKTMGCEVCGQIIDVPMGVKSFTCPYCGSIYDVSVPTLGNEWLWPFVGGVILSAIIFTGVGRSMVKTLSEATLTELQAATARRKAKLGG